jgi:hypothetical protein
MKYFLIVTFFVISSFSYADTNVNCEGALAKLKSECNIVGKSMDKMRKFSKENKTIEQTLGIEKKGKVKSLKEFSKENKTIDQTFRNIKEKFKKKNGN